MRREIGEIEKREWRVAKRLRGEGMQEFEDRERGWRGMIE